MKLPQKTLERKLFNEGYDFVIGVDEVGMGCLAGPVVVCATVFNKNFFKKYHKKLGHLRDSKLLLPHQREKFAKELKKEGDLKFCISYCKPKTIDRINIYQAARFAMRRAIKKLVSSILYPVSRDNPKTHTKYDIQDTKYRLMVLVDGKTKIAGINLPQTPIVKGDRKIFSIACASILAKVARDKRMINYSKKYPQYGFEKHKGYSTKFHQAQLAAFGPSKLHRRSFAPVSKLI